MSTLSVINIKSQTANTPPVIGDSNGTQIGTFCRAWVNIDASSGTPTIRNSFNVSSITDTAVGVLTINFTTSMPDANYTTVCNAGRTVQDFTVFSIKGGSTMYSSNVTIATGTAAFVLADCAQIQAAIFR